MEQAQTKEQNKLVIVAFIIGMISFLSFLIVFINMLLPFFPNATALRNIFSNIITNKNFSLFSSLFLLTSVTSLILSFIARKEIRLHKKPGRKIARLIYRAAVLEIIIFLILLIVYFIR